MSALGLLVTAVLAVDPFAGLPGVVAEVPMHGGQETMGIPVQARAVRTTLKPLEAFAWVHQRFKDAQLYIPPESTTPQLHGAPQITGYDHPSRRSYTAIFLANPDHTTTVIAGTADLRAKPKASTGDLPVAPGASSLVTTSSESGRAVTYQVPLAREQVDAFYVKALEAEGWKRETPSGTWLRAGKALTVRVQAKTGAPSTVVLHEVLSP